MLEIQKNNPLHGLKLEVLVTELVEHYGFPILADYLNMNCFRSNASIKSTLKFLRKTPWAREKVESFYLYKFKSLPRPSDDEYDLPPRDRTIPLDQKPSKPAVIKPKEEGNYRKSVKKKRSDSPYGSGGRRSDSYGESGSRSGSGDRSRSGSQSSSSKSDSNVTAADIWGKR